MRRSKVTSRIVGVLAFLLVLAVAGGAVAWMVSVVTKP